MPIPSHYKDAAQPFYNGFAITKSDVTILDPVTRGVLVTGAGNLAVVLEGDTNPITIPVNANTLYPFACKQVMSTNTTATGILGFI